MANYLVNYHNNKQGLTGGQDHGNADNQEQTGNNGQLFHQEQGAVQNANNQHKIQQGGEEELDQNKHHLAKALFAKQLYQQDHRHK